MQRLFTLKLLFVLIALFAIGSPASLTVIAQEAETAVTNADMGAYYVHYETTARSSFDATLQSLNGALINDYAGFLDGVVSVSLPIANAEALSASANVSFMEPMPVREMMAEYIPYGLGVVQARQVWDTNGDDVVDGFSGAGYTVCVIDSGAISAHKDFAGATMTGISQINGETWNNPGNDHGSHVSGTVGARLQGIGLPGVAPESNFHIVKVFNNSGVWVTGQSDLVAAVQNCVSNGADIINMSLGGGISSTTESNAFQTAYNGNVLSVAAAGNGGISTGTVDAFSYPASYDAVMSVANIDSSLAHNTSSQENSQLEIAAPGTDVMSTVTTPNNGGIPFCQVTAGVSTVYDCAFFEFASDGTTTGTLVDGGLCGTADVSATWNGNIVLCERGIDTFRVKVDNSEGAGSIGTIIYNNVAGTINGTLGSGTSAFPVVALTQAQGQFLFNNMLGTTVTVSADEAGTAIAGPGGYASFSGTSMASPHVAGAAAVIWSACPEITVDQLRAHMTEFAINPNGRGLARDITFGWGIVKIDDAINGLFDGVNTYTGNNNDGGNPMNAECPEPLAVELSGTETAGSVTLWLPLALAIMMLSTAVVLGRRSA